MTDLTPARAMAYAATLKSMLFDAQAHTGEHKGFVASAVLAIAAREIKNLWGAECAIASLISNAAVHLRASPKMIDRAIHELADDLARDDLSKIMQTRAEEHQKVLALQVFADTVAALETPDEIDKRTDSAGMSGDDAVDTLSNLIDMARRLSIQRPADAYPFRADVPGHEAPEGGQL